MAKLRDDEIKWILNLDAKGVQGELQKISSVINKLTQENKNLAGSNRETEKEMKGLEKQMIKLEKAGKSNSDAYEKLRNQYKASENNIYENSVLIEQNKRKIKEQEKVYGESIRTMKLSDMTMSQLKRRYDELKQALHNTSKAADPAVYKQLEKDLKATSKQIGKLTTDTNMLCNIISMGIGSFLGNFAIKIFDFFKNTIGDAFNKIKEFEQANANLASILGTTRKEIKDLTEEAKRLGAITVYTSSQVTMMQTELAKLGFEKQDIKNMTEDILNFATAAGADLPAAAAMAGASMRAFGLESNDMNRIVSTLAVATTKSAITFNYLDAAMSTIAPVAKTFGFTIEDTVALLGTLANSGFDASSAATATRNILLNLADSSGKLAIALGRPIKSLDDLAPALAELKNKGIDLNETLQLTDKRSVSAFNTFLSNAKSITALRDSVTGVGDDLQKMVDERLNTLEGSILMLKSAWEALMLSFSGSTGIFRWFIDSLTWILSQIVMLLSGTHKYQAAISLVIKSLLILITVGTAYWAGLKLQAFWNNTVSAAVKGLSIRQAAHNLVLKATNAEIAKHNILAAAARMVILAFSAAKALLTGNITKAREAMHLFNQTVKANPWGLLLSVIAGVIVAIALFRDRTKELTQAQKSKQEIDRKTAEQYDEQAAKIEILNKRLRDEKESLSNRKKALDELKKIIPDYHADLTAEGKLINENKKAIDDYLVSIEKEIRLKAAKEELEDLYRKKRTSEKSVSDQEKIVDSGEREIKRLNSTIVSGSYAQYNNELKLSAGRHLGKANAELESRKNVLKQTLDAIKEIEDELRGQNIADLFETDQFTPTSTPEGKESEVKAALDLRLKLLETAYKERQLLIEQNRDREGMDENEYQRNLLLAEDDYLAARIKILSNFHTSYEKLQTEADEKLLDDKKKSQQNQRKFDELVLAYMQDEHKKQLALIDKAATDERVKLQLQYESRTITKEQYDARLLALEYSSAKTRQDAIAGYEQALTDVTIANESLKIERIEKAGEERVAAEQNTLLKLSALNKNYYESDLSIRQLYGKISVEKQQQDELAKIKAMYDEKLISAEVYEIAKTAIEKKYEDEKLKVRQEYSIAKMDELHKAELDALKEKLDRQLLTEEEYEEAKLRLKLKHAEEYAQKSQQFTQGLSDAVQSIEKAQTAKIGAEYSARQSQLTEQFNQGLISQEEYNQQKEQLDYEQKVAELETQKKYADANFALQVSQIVASTALSAMQSFSAMSGIPYVGPVLGALAAAAAIAAGAAQISSAKTERDRIKSLTIESPGGGGGNSTPTGQRVLKTEGFAEGGMHVDGGYTGDGGRYQVAGHFPDGQPYHKAEYIVAQPELRDPAIVNMVRNIENVRRKRTSKNSIRGFAEGGLHTDTSPGNIAPTSSVSPEMMALMSNMNNLLSDLNTNGVKARASVALSEIKAAEALNDKSTSTFSKR